MSEFNSDSQQFTEKTILYCDQCERECKIYSFVSPIGIFSFNICDMFSNFTYHRSCRLHEKERGRKFK